MLQCDGWLLASPLLVSLSLVFIYLLSTLLEEWILPRSTNLNRGSLLIPSENCAGDPQELITQIFNQHVELARPAYISLISWSCIRSTTRILSHRNRRLRTSASNLVDLVFWKDIEHLCLSGWLFGDLIWCVNPRFVEHINVLFDLMAFLIFSDSD